MQAEPQWSTAVVLVAGLAAFYIWYLLAHASIFDRVFAYPRDRWGALWMCSFCAGWWISGLLLLAAGTYDPVTHLATAGLVGVVGGYVS